MSLIVVHARAGGPCLHPRGCYKARIEGFSEPETSPFGIWVRVVFRTQHGRVATVLAPYFDENSDLGLIAAAALNVGTDKLPDELDLTDLVGRTLVIEVNHERQHGAECAVARIISMAE
jgi:hypothetical protein